MSEKCTRYIKGEFFLNDSGLTVSSNISEISQEYLNCYILGMNKEIYNLGGGTAQRNLDVKRFRKIKIKYPPLEEQKQIVKKLDATFIEIDKAIELQKRKIQNTIKILENHLSKLFSEDNKSWKKASLKEITTKIGSGATPKGGQSSYKNEGISLIRSMNVHDLKMVRKNLAKIDDAQAAKLSNVSVKENDVLLNITGASVARCALVDKDILPARVNQHVSIIRVIKESINPKLLSYMLVSKFYKDKLLAVGEGGGATRQAITKKQIEEFVVKYPNSVEEQKQIAKKLDAINLEKDGSIKALNSQIDNYIALKSSILSNSLKTPSL